MSFDWSMYLELAQELTLQAADSSYQDAKLRSAVSRAYYAAFLKARNHVRDVDKQPVPMDGSAHRYVAQQFKQSTVKERRNIGVNLERMRLYRGKADYDDRVANLQATTKDCLRKASAVLSTLKTLQTP